MKRFAPKILAGVITGNRLPKHLGIAYGRHIFQLFHVPKTTRKDRKLWLRDLPLSITELDYNYGFDAPLRAYVDECNRVGIPHSERVADIVPAAQVDTIGD